MKIAHHLAVAALSFAACTVAGCDVDTAAGARATRATEVDLSRYSDLKPSRTMKLLFIHHSCGGQWLADMGDEKEIIPKTCIYTSHPNGGGLKRALQENNYEVHEAAYRSPLGEKTDVCDWNRKFREHMNEILVCDRQEKSYREPATRNDIVVFKSCFPNSWIVAEGKEPGDPEAPAKTTANHKAAYRKLLGYFAAHPGTLFVCVTAPPLAETPPSRTKELLKNLLRSGTSYRAVGERVRNFNNWLKDAKSGWLSGYELHNVVVFDYYDLLTGHGRSNYSLYPTRGGTDSHPSAEGNCLATYEFIPFLNRAVDRLATRK